MAVVVKNLLPAERLRDPADSEVEEYESDSELETDVDENTLFKKTVGYSVIKSYVSVLIEFWRE